MKYKEIEKLEGEKFRRLTGVKKATFERMIEVLDNVIIEIRLLDEQYVARIACKNQFQHLKITLLKIKLVFGEDIHI